MTTFGSLDTGDVSISYENETGLSDNELLPSMREVASKLETWVRQTRRQTPGGLLSRSAYLPSENPYEIIDAARNAVRDDDIVSAAADVTEGLILQGVTFESANDVAADLMNQLAAEIDIDGYLRTAYREMFTQSQAITATWWGYREYTPRVRSVKQDKKNADGTARSYPKRKKFRLYVPTKLVTLDAKYVVPVGRSIFGEDRLCWHATDSMLDAWGGVEAAPYTNADPLLTSLFLGRYTPPKDEEAQLTDWRIDPRRLMEFRPDTVWRHTRTKSAWQPFPDVRMKSIFRQLDLKQQLMESDRVMLIGSANYLLLVRKGSDAHEASQNELANLREGFKAIAKLPVIVADHRLTIDIITPALDQTLIASRYDVLDARILSRLFGSPQVNSGARGDQTAGTTSRMIARGLENQRHMLRRSVEQQILRRIWEHPRNAEALRELGPDSVPSLAFQPRNVQLDNDAQLISTIMAARQSRDLSRESFLDFLGYDQAVEARRLQREAEIYDDIFQTAVPYSSDGGTSATDGAQGGRPVGGGSSSQSAQGQVKKRTASGAPSTGGAGS